MIPTGRLAALVAIVGVAMFWIPVAFGGSLLLVLLAAFVGEAWALRRAPEVERTVPREVVRGVPVDLSVRVAPRRGRRVLVRQPQTADLRVDPSEGIGEIQGQLVARVRGPHVLPAVVTRTTGPLRFAIYQHRHGEPLGVMAHADLPAGRRIAAAVAKGTFKDPGLRRGPLGLGTDFETVRDYVPDDDIRRMNWLASERAGRPMVNQYREDTERDLWCLVDTGRLLASPVGDRTRLDAALDAVAAVAAVADVVGDRVGAVVFDDQVRSTIRPRRSSAAGLVRALDEVQPTIVDSDYDAAFGRVGSAKRSLVILFTDLLDGAAADPLLYALPVLVRRHAVLVAGVVDPDLVAATTTPPSTRRQALVASVAGDLLEDRSRVRTQLESAGAVVVDAAADGLPSACVGAYLRLKAVARL